MRTPIISSTGKPKLRAAAASPLPFGFSDSNRLSPGAVPAIARRWLKKKKKKKILLAHAAGAGTLNFTYDPAGRLIRVNSGGNTNTTFSYDHNGNFLGQATFVSGNPDLSLAQSAAPDPVVAGTLLQYNISVFNNSAAAASVVTLTNTFPVNAAFVSSSASDGTVTRTGNVLTWNVGTLAGAASATLQFAIRPNAAGTLTNIATVKAAQVDPSPGNNSGVLLTQTVPPPSATALLDGETLTLFWPILGGNGFTAQYSDSLSPPDWKPLNAPITVQGNWLRVEETRTNMHRFYRLVAH